MKNLRILLATDGSIEADIARAVLKRLPVSKQVTATVAMVTQLPAMVMAGLAPEAVTIADRTATDTWRIRKEVARQTVDRVARKLRAEGFEAKGIVLDGNTADELLELITKDKAELAVAGCGTNSNVAAFFLGSVSRKLVLYSEASVLIGRHYTDQKSEDSYRTVMGMKMLDLVVAVDGSKGADLAIESLTELKQPAFDHIYVVSVEPLMYPVTDLDPGLYLPSGESDMARIRDIAKAAADRIRSSGKQVETVTAFGRPSAEITRIAKERGADLIMLGANRHGALERLLIGSCAYETATSAPCSVLILRDTLPFTGDRL